MQITSINDVDALVKNDQWMMQVLEAAETLNLPDWWIGAGFLRNKVWDAIENNGFKKSRDIDLVYFDSSDTFPETDWHYDEEMNTKHPFGEWEVRNQARMHLRNNLEPFTSAPDGIAHWVETATCVAVHLKEGKLEFLFCHGESDLFSMIARPIPLYQSPERIQSFYDRVEQKKWRERWPGLKVLDS